MKRYVCWAGAMALAATGSAASLDEVIARLERAERDIKTLQFDYSQKTTLARGGHSITGRGTARFQRPNRFRVDVSLPHTQTVVSDGKSLWIHLPDRSQVIRDSMDNWSRSGAFPQGLTPFQMTVKSMKDRYTWTLEAADDGPVVVLIPAGDQSPSHTLRLWVDMDTGLARRTELSADTVTAVVDVSNVTVNPTLAGSDFRFVPPPGAEVLTMPAQTRK